MSLLAGVYEIRTESSQTQGDRRSLVWPHIASDSVLILFGAILNQATALLWLGEKHSPGLQGQPGATTAHDLKHSSTGVTAHFRNAF